MENPLPDVPERSVLDERTEPMRVMGLAARSEV